MRLLTLRSFLGCRHFGATLRTFAVRPPSTRRPITDPPNIWNRCVERFVAVAWIRTLLLIRYPALTLSISFAGT